MMWVKGNEHMDYEGLKMKNKGFGAPGEFLRAAKVYWPMISDSLGQNTYYPYRTQESSA